MSTSRVELTRLLERTNEDEGKRTALNKELEEEWKQVGKQDERLAKLERQLDQMKDKFEEAVTIQGDLSNKRMLIVAQLERALGESTLFKNKWKEEKERGEAAHISEGEDYRQQLEQQNL